MTTHSKAHWFLFSTNHVVWKRHSQECIKSITAVFLVSENHVKKKERHSSCLVNIFLTQKERNALEVLIGTAFYISYSACATNERSSFATTWVHRPGSWSNVWIKARFWFSFYLVFLSGKSRVLQTDRQTGALVGCCIGICGIYWVVIKTTGLVGVWMEIWVSINNGGWGG